MEDCKKIDLITTHRESEDDSAITKGNQENPWQEPMNLIAWGLILTLFTVNYQCLDYILPTIGTIFLFLGFYSLRKCNPWFYTAWIIVMIKLCWQPVSLIIIASPMNRTFQNFDLIMIVIILLQMALLFIFRQAIRTVFYKNKITPNRDPLLLIIVMYIIILICGYLHLSGFILVFLLLFLWKILYSLNKVGEDMGAVSDAFVIIPPKIRILIVPFIYMIGCILLVLGSCILSNHIILDGAKQTPITESKTRSKLIDMGFPKEIMKDISDKNIEELRDAVYVSASSDILNFDSEKGTTLYENSVTETNKPGNVKLKASTIYIELPNNLFYVVVYFDWMKQKVKWQDGFTIWGANGFELLDGVLLYRMKGEDYTAPIPRLKSESVTENSLFGKTESREILGAVSYPFRSENQRGYVFYKFKLKEDNVIGSNCLNYMHFTNPFQLPYEDTEKRITQNIFNHHIKQHNTNFESHAY